MGSFDAHAKLVMSSEPVSGETPADAPAPPPLPPREAFLEEFRDRFHLASSPAGWTEEEWDLFGEVFDRHREPDTPDVVVRTSIDVPRDVLLAAAAALEAAQGAAGAASTLLRVLAGPGGPAGAPIGWSCPSCGGTKIQRGATFGSEWAFCADCGDPERVPPRQTAPWYGLRALASGG